MLVKNQDKCSSKFQAPIPFPPPGITGPLVQPVQLGALGGPTGPQGIQGVQGPIGQPAHKEYKECKGCKEKMVQPAQLV